jgi:hypothetical protein
MHPHPSLYEIARMKIRDDHARAQLRALRQQLPGRPKRSRAPGTVLVWAAFVLGVAHAGVSAYWLVGGLTLLDTVGGTLEELGRAGGPTVRAALALIVAVKVAIALSGLLVTGRVESRVPPWARGRPASVATLLVAVAMAAYGAVHTSVGLLIQLGIVATAPDANHHALAWHTYVWDPWFLAWGLCLGAGVLAHRPRTRQVPVPR